MSMSQVSSTQFSSPLDVYRHKAAVASVKKTESCPEFRNKNTQDRFSVRRTESIVSKLAHLLLKKEEVSFECSEDGTTFYEGASVSAHEVRKIVECKGIQVYESSTILIFPKFLHFVTLSTFDPIKDFEQVLKRKGI